MASHEILETRFAVAQPLAEVLGQLPMSPMNIVSAARGWISAAKYSIVELGMMVKWRSRKDRIGTTNCL
jgi:hypothetical protein